MTGDLEKKLQQIKKGAKKEGVTFKGTIEEGTFSGKGIKGEYWIEGKILYFDLKQKPFLVPESYIVGRISAFLSD